jgi:PleD family two-component response regulator
MCDIDFFKKFNDNYGHLAGDEILRTVARIIAENVRSSDIVARYGGEEFAVLLMETGIREAENVAKRLKKLMDQSIEVAERIKDVVEHTHIKFDGKEIGVTLSLGLSSYDGQEDYKPEYLISGADHALYESKNKGRNLLTIFNPETKEFKSYS